MTGAQLEALREQLGEGRVALPRGGGSKPALSTPPAGVDTLDLSGLAGIVEYDPRELTITVGAGTRVSSVARTLAEHGQRLPFDPPLGSRGATVGGAVAAGTSGPCSHRFGGVRDAILGVRFLDGAGRLISAGGRVVKNAAGYDIPKLFVGSCGRLGVMTEVTFKVVPAPDAWGTLVTDFGDVSAALDALDRVGRGPVELEAIELLPPGTVLVRVSDTGATLSARLDRVARVLGGRVETRLGDDDRATWDGLREFDSVPSDARLTKVALTPRRVPELERALAGDGAQRRYSRGGHTAWVADDVERSVGRLDSELSALGLGGVVLRGGTEKPLLGAAGGDHPFARRVRATINRNGVFAEL